MSDEPEETTEDGEDPALARLYHSQKDRIFVRSIQGEYGLTEELRRLRAMPRVRKANEIKFVDGPQAYSRHYVAAAFYILDDLEQLDDTPEYDPSVVRDAETVRGYIGTRALVEER
jgi:hypothetical protein